MKNLILIICATLFACIAQTTVAQSDEGFIFGTITTIDEDTYTGPIRWGKEEVYWTDFFNSTKVNNDYLKYLTDEDMNNMSNNTWWEEFLNIHIENYSWDDHTHSFACQFGDIRSINLIGRSSVEVELKNGFVYKLKGGSNDIGATVRIIDQDAGKMKIEWDRIDKVEFTSTPENLLKSFGDPLYGTVETLEGTFTGQIQWDHDERLTTDELDGDTRDGDMSVSFGKIKSISKEGKGSLVVLNSGKEIYLSGSNDVDSDNRGIIVTVEGIGRVDIDWESFRKVSFEEKVLSSGPPYASFTEPNHISGTVHTVDDISVSGMIVFDLDEVWDIEVLHGKDGDVEYQIPFRNVKRIIPKNYKYSKVEFRNGEEVVIGGMQDVSDKNDGLLVFEGEDDPVYIPWEEVEEVVFK